MANLSQKQLEALSTLTGPAALDGSLSLEVVVLAVLQFCPEDRAPPRVFTDTFRGHQVVIGIADVARLLLAQREAKAERSVDDMTPDNRAGFLALIKQLQAQVADAQDIARQAISGINQAKAETAAAQQFVDEVVGMLRDERAKVDNLRANLKDYKVGHDVQAALEELAEWRSGKRSGKRSNKDENTEVKLLADDLRAALAYETGHCGGDIDDDGHYQELGRRCRQALGPVRAPKPATGPETDLSLPPESLDGRTQPVDATERDPVEVSTFGVGSISAEAEAMRRGEVL